MTGGTGIGWTDETWNPTTGCDRISPGCANCYALTMAGRLKKMGSAKYQNDGDPRTSGPGFGLTVHPDTLDQPIRWTRPRMIFVNSMSDLFHRDVPEWFISAVWDVMTVAPHHTFQILTKRSRRMRQVLTGESHGMAFSTMPWVGPVAPLSNVWLGVSVETEPYQFRIDDLRATPAALRFLSLEPLLGPLDALDLTDIGWVIVGGESGPNARLVDPDWVRSIRDQCAAAGVPFFFKQWGGTSPKSNGNYLDGRLHEEIPERKSA